MDLVTGGTGFLGSLLLKTLTSRGDRVRAFKHRKTSVPTDLHNNTAIEWIEGDITDMASVKEAVKYTDRVYNLVGIGPFAAVSTKRRYEVNVLGVANLVNAAIEHGLTKLVHVSSTSSLGSSTCESLIDENNLRYQGPAASEGTCAQSRYLAENEVWRGIEEGLPAIIVNPSLVLGNTNWVTGAGRLLASVQHGSGFYPAGGCGFIDASDVIRILIDLMESDISGERFILNAENLSYKDFFTRAALVFGRPQPFVQAGKWSSFPLAYFQSLASGNPMPPYANMLKWIGKNYFYDNSKIKKALPTDFLSITQAIQKNIMAKQILVQKDRLGLA